MSKEVLQYQGSKDAKVDKTGTEVRTGRKWQEQKRSSRLKNSCATVDWYMYCRRCQTWQIQPRILPYPLHEHQRSRKPAPGTVGVEGSHSGSKNKHSCWVDSSRILQTIWQCFWKESDLALFKKVWAPKNKIPHPNSAQPISSPHVGQNRVTCHCAQNIENLTP